MGKWFRDLDRILRGEATSLPALRAGRIDVEFRGVSVVLLLLGLISGACVGSFAVFRAGGPFLEQLVASTVKVPALFFLTLVVTFPSLYVFNTLVGSKLTISSLLRLLVASLGVTLALLAAFGPIVAFFSVSTTSYPFMVLLNVVVFAVSGLLGLKFLLQTLHRLSLVAQEPQAIPPEAFLEETPAGPAAAAPIAGKPLGALDPLEGQTLGRHVKTVVRCWVVVFGLVGAQMSWVLRPFIGNPDVPFEWFRARESHFFEAVRQALLNLFS
ncbi:MAG: hypothetical protein ACT4QC_17535 [Planctomycetaceae bacterium]